MNEALVTLLAGVAGILVALGGWFAFNRFLTWRRRKQAWDRVIERELEVARFYENDEPMYEYRTYVNPNKDRRLSGKARKRQRQHRPWEIDKKRNEQGDFDLFLFWCVFTFAFSVMLVVIGLTTDDEEKQDCSSYASFTDAGMLHQHIFVDPR